MQITAGESRFFGLIGGLAEEIVIYRNAYSTFMNLINYPGNGCVGLSFKGVSGGAVRGCP